MEKHPHQNHEQKTSMTSIQRKKNHTQDLTLDSTSKEDAVILQVLSAFKDIQKELQEDARIRGMSNCCVTPISSSPRTGSTKPSDFSATSKVKSRFDIGVQSSGTHFYNHRTQLFNQSANYLGP
ncbi:uncharacterized protein C12orf54 homolog isoform X2 [Cavia porcellus]|uniref:uncharacterized protein C12orf54 homolog isoform X2 n=1 Tax=Cavia porcellus TaxID=10141 RepID=UPI002FE1EF6C